MEEKAVPKKKKFDLLIPLLSIVVVLTVGYKGFGIGEEVKSQFNLFPTTLTENLVVPNTATSTSTPPLPKEGLEALKVWEQYINYAHAHDLKGLRSVSYQVSSTCLDPAKVSECNTLMDNVYNIGTVLGTVHFTHMVSDSRQMIIYSDGPSVAILIFTRDTGTPKVLSLRFCFEDKTSTKCIDPVLIKTDRNANGWWDGVESLFYKL